MIKLKIVNEPHSPTYFYYKNEISFIKYYDGVIVYYDLMSKPVNSSKYYYYPKLTYRKKNYFFGQEPGKRITMEKFMIYAKDLSTEKKIPELEELALKLKQYDKRDKAFSTSGLISIGVGMYMFFNAITLYNHPGPQIIAFAFGVTSFVIGFNLESGSIINKIKKHIVSKKAVELYNTHRDKP